MTALVLSACCVLCPLIGASPPAAPTGSFLTVARSELAPPSALLMPPLLLEIAAPAAMPRHVARAVRLPAVERRPKNTSAWLSLAISGTTLVAGSVLGAVAVVLRNQLAGAIEKGEIEWTRWDRLTRRGSTLAVAAYTLYFVSAAFGTAGTWLLLIGPPKRRGIPVAIAPAGLGAVVHATF